jgi:hypothetical protein
MWQESTDEDCGFCFVKHCDEYYRYLGDGIDAKKMVKIGIGIMKIVFGLDAERSSYLRCRL